jgi:hypothetical protein
MNDYGYSMPSIDQCREIRRILIECGTRQFHIFMSYTEGMEWMDIEQARWGEQRALVGKYNVKAYDGSEAANLS